MAEKPKLLFHSNAPWTSTGYGQQTALFVQKLAEHYQLVISAFYGLEGTALPWHGIPVLPGIGQTYGNECVPEHARAVFGKDVRSGLVVTLMDVWVLDPAIWREFNVASWVPVDHEPAPGPVREFFEHSGAIPLAMSKFGQEQLADLEPLYVPHGVDTEVYKPVPRDEAREATGIPQDAYIVGMVAANKGNPSRKCFSEAFQAFKIFHDQHPEAKLYLHTDMRGRFGGVNLLALLDRCDIPVDAAIFCDQYRAIHRPFSPETMAQVYSSMDVLLAASAGEGFGIPTIEAQACGVPVIVSDFSAQPELVGAGWKVKGIKHDTPIGSWQFTPDVGDIAEVLCEAHSQPELSRGVLSEKARAKALEYDAARVFSDYMLPALEQVQERFEDRKPQTLVAA